ncbi:MAG: type I-U CRISPR-associated helicase/endonuclease Cas3 [Burkholderiales bacterium]
MAFDDDFRLLTGNPPFPWQRAMYERLLAGNVPKACDLPTGLGKTSVITLWLLALTKNPRLPRRLVYVVNRRTVVDQSTAEAERLCNKLVEAEARPLRDALDAMAAVKADRPLAVSTLRGEFADNGEWRRDPSRPAIIIGTVDMIGSRLLFSGYGCGFRSKPLHAGFLGQDALLVHDEAHLEPAFQSLLGAIADEQQRCMEPRPLKVLALSATGRDEPDFTLSEADLGHEVVLQRLGAKKGLQIHRVDDRKDLPQHVASRAGRLHGKIIVFLSSVDHVERCAQLLRKGNKCNVVTLTGTMRGAERDLLVEHPVFARFLRRPDKDVKLHDGTVYLVATSAGEVGIDLSADHLVTDLPPFDALAQRLGRVNRYGEVNAEVHVYCEKLKEPPDTNPESDDADEDDKPASRSDAYDHARFYTLSVLGELPMRDHECLDASPGALRALPRDARLRASTPLPEIPHVDALQFDRWSYTTVTGKLPGRHPVAEWLHGKADWEPPRTSIAWRREVSWLTKAHLGKEKLDDFLADYPLRSRERLSDITSRVLVNLRELAKRDKEGVQNAWLVRQDKPAEIVKLVEIVESYDPKKNPTLDDATLVLAPEAGGLNQGLLDGAAEFDPVVPYDLGSSDAERIVHESEDRPDAPMGMRLVRSVKRMTEADDEVLQWWHLYAISRRADDDGSRSSQRELLLDVHLRRTEAWAAQLAQTLALPEHLQLALARAGRVHDLGKQRRVWQRSIKRMTEPPLAKGPMQPSELGHYRHELGSLHDGDYGGLSEDARDLALHIVAAHHGRARPHFPTMEGFDPELKSDVVAALLYEVPRRFDRLQRRYGRWGLAWLESILRAADVLGSEDEEVAE